MKSINGVDSVDVSLNKGLATMTFKPGNNVTMKQLRDAIARNGFTTKQSKVVVDGTFSASGGAPKLTISGSGEVFPLTVAETGANAEKFEGKNVTIGGTIPEAAKGKPDSI